MTDGMESRQSLWHNRRVQRSGLFAFFVLTFIVIGLYNRREWPAAPDAIGPSTDFVTPSNGLNELPLHDKTKPPFDRDNMPQIPKSKAPSKPYDSGRDPNLDPSRVAMIIETRSLAHMPALLASYITILPPQWVIRMIGSPNAFDNVRSSAPLQRAVRSGRLVLTDLPDEYPVNGQEAISATLTNLTFYRDFLAPAEWLLIFQADSVLCAASDQTMDDWIEKGYPWVGAPWNPDVPGGNGGLSLRYVPRLISILEKESRKSGDLFWEDRWLCDRINDTALPPVAKYFSVESMWYERPMGYHLRGSGKMLDLTIWGNAAKRRHIFKYCPETKLILGNMLLPDKDDEKLEEEENRPLGKAVDGVLSNAAQAVKEELDKAPPDRHVPPKGDTKPPGDAPKEQKPKEDAKKGEKPKDEEAVKEKPTNEPAAKKERDKADLDKDGDAKPKPRQKQKS